MVERNTGVPDWAWDKEVCAIGPSEGADLKYLLGNTSRYGKSCFEECEMHFDGQTGVIFITSCRNPVSQDSASPAAPRYEKAAVSLGIS